MRPPKGHWFIATIATVLFQVINVFGQWPMQISTKDAAITVYTPQPESYEDGRFVARAAVSVKTAAEKAPLFGAIWMQGFLEVDRDTRMGELRQFDVTDVRFPTITDTTKIRRFREFLTKEIPKQVAPVQIDLIVAALERGSNKEEAFSNEPPEIIYLDHDGVLLFLDGEPIYEPLGDSGYDRVLNSALVLLRKSGGSHYLYAASAWFNAPKALGPYTASDAVPADLRMIAQKVDSAMRATGDYEEPSSTAPEVVVRSAPAELITTDGPADLKPVEGTSLLSVRNSRTPLFLELSSQRYFALLSGRWFTTNDLSAGPWTFVKGEDLPSDFALIPEGTEEDEVLSSVPGTPAAVEATHDAMIPQTAAIDRKNVQLQVTYKGDPEWKAVDGTNMSYAVNASTTVLKVGDRYHVCDDAVWYDGPGPSGPWSVSTSVPDPVKDIDPSSPVYNVKYVQVYESTPEVVYVGYTPGYTGCYVHGGTVVYGTGFYYPPPPPIYYYPRPCTWGFSVRYNPWSGWTTGVHFRVGWFQFSSYSGWGGCYRCGGWWGPPRYHPPYRRPYYGGHGYYGHRRPNTGGRPATITPPRGRGDRNLYDRAERPGVRPSRPAPNNARPSTGGASSRPGGTPGSGATTRPAPKPSGSRDVYADPKGNVYRGTGSSTQKYDNGRWDKVRPPSGTNSTRPSTRPSNPPVRPRPAPTDRPLNRPAPSGRPMIRPAPYPTRPSTGDPFRMQQDRARSIQRSNNFNQFQQRARPMPRPGGGGARPMPQMRSGGSRGR